MVVYGGGANSSMRSTSSSAVEVVAMVGAPNASLPSCVVTASMISVLPWPRLVVKTPDRPSM